MKIKEQIQTYTKSLADFESEAYQYAEKVMQANGSNSPLSILDLFQLASIIIKTLPTHLIIKHKIKKDASLPDLISNDPPSLRANLWMVLIDSEIRRHNKEVNIKKELLKIPYAYELFTLTRSWANSMDDAVDTALENDPNAENPVLPTKKELRTNEEINKIVSVLANYFLRVYRENPDNRLEVRKTLREYRIIRDFEYKIIEDVFCEFNGETGRMIYSEDKVTFNKAVEFAALSMSPITYLLIKTVLNGNRIDEETEKNLKYAISLYATAGKMIDDLTDWAKDYYSNQLNIFTIAMKEKGELGQVVQKAEKFIKSKNHTFIPISLLQKWSPKAFDMYKEEMDRMISALDKTPFKQLSMSMKATRQVMWAYAMNEGEDQITNN